MRREPIGHTVNDADGGGKSGRHFCSNMGLT
jgi:hypothetical protein